MSCTTSRPTLRRLSDLLGSAREVAALSGLAASISGATASLSRATCSRLYVPAALVCVVAALAPSSLGAAQSGVARSEVAPRPPQGVEYRIEARLDEAAQQLEGRARVRYRNNSPDTIADFYFHLYLNAFRPNSLWARTDLSNGITTFQELGPDEHGFERLHSVTIGGNAVPLRYPFAPDSTIVSFQLPQPLTPGASVELDLRWDARPSSVPRRQGRAGRQWDFAQWYPRVVVYDDEGWRPHPLYRQGEFYGEFATYDVTLEVADDQVMGATGVPVEGDPGWQDAAVLGTGPILYDREWYGSLEGPPCVERGGERICGVYPARRLGTEEPLGLLAAAGPPSGSKRVRWHAEDVHHFAWSTSPDFIYEQGRWNDISIHVLYRPGDEQTWGEGIAVRRTATALAWMDSIFGTYPYPQVTNLHRLEGGGTEFPMLVMDGSASQGLILHEVGHIYAHGILANNEWYEGWLDEGLSSFQTAWFSEATGATDDAFAGSVASVIARDVDGISEPVVLEAEKYAAGNYSPAIYTKGSVVFWMLRELAGDEAFRRILRTYYERHQFTHVDTDDFKAVAEEVLGRDLDAFFAGWLHTTGLVDYALEDVTIRAVGGGYQTEFTVVKKGDLRMDVPVVLRGASGPAGTGAGAGGASSQVGTVIADGGALRERLAVTTSFRPSSIVLDPQGRTLDWNPSNDGWSEGLLSDPMRRLALDRAPLASLPRSFETVPARVLPLLWANEIGGVTAGVRLRSSLAGVRSTQLTLGLPTMGIGRLDVLPEGGEPPTDFGSAHLMHERRGVGGDAGTRFFAEGFVGEGRALARVLKSFGSGPVIASGVGSTGSGSSFGAVAGTTWSVGGTLAGIRDVGFAIPTEWSTARSVAAEVEAGWARRADPANQGLSLRARAGLGFDTQDRQWLRVEAAGATRRELTPGWQLSLDFFAGGVAGSFGGNSAPPERRFSLGSGDAWQTLGNPLLRSRASLLDQEGWVSGGGTLRGFIPRLTFPWVATAAATLIGSRRTVAGYDVRPLMAFGLGTAGAPEASIAALGHGELLWSLGPGVEIGQPDAPLILRVDLPLLMSHPELAATANDATFGPRLQVGFVRR